VKNGDERDRVKQDNSVISMSDLVFNGDSCVLRKRQTIEITTKAFAKTACRL